MNGYTTIDTSGADWGVLTFPLIPELYWYSDRATRDVLCHGTINAADGEIVTVRIRCDFGTIHQIGWDRLVARIEQQLRQDMAARQLRHVEPDAFQIQPADFSSIQFYNHPTPSVGTRPWGRRDPGH